MLIRRCSILSQSTACLRGVLEDGRAHATDVLMSIRRYSPTSPKRLLIGIVISLICATATHAQCLVDTQVAWADGSSLLLQLKKTGVQQSNGDAFDAFMKIDDKALKLLRFCCGAKTTRLPPHYSWQQRDVGALLPGHVAQLFAGRANSVQGF
jgi:hypothetical protein